MRSHEEPTAAQRGGRWLRGSSLVALNPNAATDSLHSLRAAGLFTRSHHTPVHISRTARESAADAAASNAANRAILDDRRDNPPPRMTQAVRITLSPSLCSPQPAGSWRRSNPEVSPRALAGAGGAALLALCAATTAVVRAIQPVAHQWARQAASRSCSPGEVPTANPRVWKAATSKAEPWQQQDWFLKCLQGVLSRHVCGGDALLLSTGAAARRR